MSKDKILVVDDEAAVRILLRNVISSAGFTVFEADCGQTALALAAEHAPFEIVVTDVLMPGMDGVELAQQLSAAGQSQGFLFVSGYCDVEQMSLPMRGFDSVAFLSKPFSIAELLGAVRRLLNRPRSGEPPAASATGD